jgi:hypothetical protein
MRPRRHGVILLDVILAAIVLALGLTIIVSLSTQSLARQIEGEHRMTASWLADELLSLILVEGPVEYSNAHPDSGRFDAPFEAYSWEVDIQHVGDWEPYIVDATIQWDARSGPASLTVNTRIAMRQGEEEEELPREPLEPLDRDARYYDDEEDGA